MANKTQVTEVSVSDYLDNIENPQRKKDCYKVFEIMNKISKVQAKMWGPSIVGYDTYHYKYESGREGDFFKMGLSPRKAALTIYIIPGFERYESLMQKLGKYKTSKSCLYIKNLEDVNEQVLIQLIKESYDYMTNKYG